MDPSALRVTFMGSAAFAVPSLSAMAAAGYRLVQVVTRADKPRGRGLDLARTPIAERATALGLPLFQPRTLRTPEVLEALREAAPDLVVVAAYGRILPPEVLALPRYGCVNVHGSILPKYRGAAPVQWAVIRGESETGVTLMQMDEGLDTGAVLAVRATPISDEDTAATVTDRLAELGAALLVESLPGIMDGSTAPVPQDDAAATLAPPLEKGDGAIDWTASSRTVRDRVRGVEPWPGAFTMTQGGLRLRVFPPVLREIGGGFEGVPGQVLGADREGMVVRTGDGAVRVLEVQPAGSRRMEARDAVAGRRVRVGDILGGEMPS
jgi:methionyl-tRNA formyltransferase